METTRRLDDSTSTVVCPICSTIQTVTLTFETFEERIPLPDGSDMIFTSMSQAVGEDVSPGCHTVQQMIDAFLSSKD